jgi:hypothetical protein
MGDINILIRVALSLMAVSETAKLLEKLKE